MVCDCSSRLVRKLDERGFDCTHLDEGLLFRLGDVDQGGSENSYISGSSESAPEKPGVAVPVKDRFGNRSLIVRTSDRGGVRYQPISDLDRHPPVTTLHGLHPPNNHQAARS